MNRYQEIMEYVEIDEKARARILQNIEEAAVNQQRASGSIIWLRRYGALAACLAVILLGTLATGVLKIVKPHSANSEPESAAHGEITSSSELTEKSGILMKEIVPIASRSEKTDYQVSSTSGAEISYELNNQTVTLQKVRDNEFEELIGDYDLTNEITIGRFTYTLSGSDGLYCVAQWSDGEFSYRMTFDPGQTEDEVLQLVSGVTRPSAGDLDAIRSGIEYPKDNEYLDWYQYATVSAPHGHSVYGFGSADHSGTAHTVLDGEQVLVLAERKGYACVIVLSQNKGRWINMEHLIFDQEMTPDANA